MKVVTAGYQFLDIDAYGGIIAYVELLNLLSEKAIAASTAPLNESITPTMRKWNALLLREYKPAADDSFVLVDISDPEFFDTFVVSEKVTEIIDHHMEFVEYWRPKLGAAAHIEFIGAACTLVAERWQQTGKLAQISPTSARLLATGILDNTLNFEAQMTTERDEQAYQVLMQYADLPADWPSQYFAECQQQILSDLPKAIKNDTKLMEFPSLRRKIRTGQIVVWDAQNLLADRKTELQSCMSTATPEWLINVISISEGKNYLLTSNQSVQHFLEQLLATKFADSVAETDRLWLRKEIMLQDLQLQHHS